MAKRRRKSGSGAAGKVIGALLAAVFSALFKRASRSPNTRPQAQARGDDDWPAGFHQEVVGEASYQAALRAVAGAGRVRCFTVARVVPEAGNPHDEHAVRVEVGGQTAGYLPRPAARAFRKKYGGAVDCDAFLVGGGPKKSIGAWLKLSP